MAKARRENPDQQAAVAVEEERPRLRQLAYEVWYQYDGWDEQLFNLIRLVDEDDDLADEAMRLGCRDALRYAEQRVRAEAVHQEPPPEDPSGGHQPVYRGPPRVIDPGIHAALEARSLLGMPLPVGHVRLADADRRVLIANATHYLNNALGNARQYHFLTRLLRVVPEGRTVGQVLTEEGLRQQLDDAAKDHSGLPQEVVVPEAPPAVQANGKGKGRRGRRRGR